MKMVIITHPLCTDAMTAAHVLNLAWPDATVLINLISEP